MEESSNSTDFVLSKGYVTRSAEFLSANCYNRLCESCSEAVRNRW